MNILLAYNDTDVSNRALERAAQLAKLYEAKLVVTSVTPVVVGEAPTMEPGPELRRADERLRELGIEATLVEAIGDIASAVVEVGETARRRTDRHRDAGAEPGRAHARALGVKRAAHGALRRADLPLAGDR